MSNSVKTKSSANVAGTAKLLGNVVLGAKTTIHDWTILGFPNRDQDLFSSKRARTVRIDQGCTIYPWCLIYEGASVGAKVEVHERCMIGSLTTVGPKSLVLYGAQIHDNVQIGSNCIVGGFIADNCSIGSGSTVFGALVHNYGRPGRQRWDRTDELGPTLGTNVIVGWGAVVIGPVCIGNNARIGPNAIVRKSVAAGDYYGH